MKYFIITFALCLLASGCSKDITVPKPKMLSAFIDITEIYRQYPDPKSILQMYELQIDDNRNGSLVYRQGVISNREVNHVVEHALADALQTEAYNTFDDALYREDIVGRWQSQVTRTISDLEIYEMTPELSHSVILKAVTAELTYLASFPNASRKLIIWSNLLENSSLGKPTYARLDLSNGSASRDSLLTSWKQVLDYEGLPGMKGIDIVIVHTPEDYNSDRDFHAMVAIYRTLFEPLLGSSIEIRASL